MASKNIKYTYAVGRRKRSSARIRLIKGKGETIVNEKKITEYFPGAVNTSKWQKPFILTDTRNTHYATVKVLGGGKIGQLDAVAHGIAKAFNKLDPKKYRDVLKKAGLLTRDARKKERRVIGTGGKARRQKQSPKR